MFGELPPLSTGSVLGSAALVLAVREPPWPCCPLNRLCRQHGQGRSLSAACSALPPALPAQHWPPVHLLGAWLEASGDRVAACMRHLLSPSSHQRIRGSSKGVSYCPRTRSCLDLGSREFLGSTSEEGDKVTGSSREMGATSVSHLLPGSIVGPPRLLSLTILS